jgi:hypothetical protein
MLVYGCSGMALRVCVDADNDHVRLLLEWLQMASDIPAVESSRRYEVTRPSAAEPRGRALTKVRASLARQKDPGSPSTPRQRCGTDR